MHQGQVLPMHHFVLSALRHWPLDSFYMIYHCQTAAKNNICQRYHCSVRMHPMQVNTRATHCWGQWTMELKSVTFHTLWHSILTSVRKHISKVTDGTSMFSLVLWNGCLFCLIDGCDTCYWGHLILISLNGQFGYYIKGSDGRLMMGMPLASLTFYSSNTDIKYL